MIPEGTTGRELGLMACPACSLVLRATVDGECPRCGLDVDVERGVSFAASWACLVAAMVLYVPANLLPILYTTKFPEYRSDTILSGIAHLWQTRNVGLAVVVFVASIVVPLAKLGALALLLVASGRRSTWRPRLRAKTFRVLERLGHWSMLDVFVVALLTSLVQLGRVARVEPGPAIVPFAAVVILTMLASAAFDPRTIWVRVAAAEPEGDS